jgi:hypothetical protein
MNANLMTASETRDNLESLGFSGPAMDLIVRAGGPARHEARVEAAISAAYSAFEAYATHEDAIIILLAELAGSGGRFGAGLGTPLTHRLPPFRDLGTGRRHAADGPAWDAAIREAVSRLYKDMAGFLPVDPLRIGARVDKDGDVLISVYDHRAPAPTEGGLCLIMADDPDNPGHPWQSEMLPWLASLARRGLLATAPGVPADVAEEAATIGERMAELEGDPQAWAALVNAANV